MLIELIGYAGTLLIVLSMLMTSVIKLRVINALGSIIFTFYALLIHSYPTAAMNFCLIIINFYNLARLLKGKKEYSFVPVNPSESFVSYFTEHYRDDIKSFFPDELKAENCNYACLICHKSTPVGLFLGNFEGEDTIKIKLDYTTPAFRDCSAGKGLYSFLAGQKINKLVIESASQEHIHYLKKMDFRNMNGLWVKELKAGKNYL